MGLLLLLLSPVLSSYLLSGSVVNVQNWSDIDSTVLSIEPTNEVQRGANVTLRCKTRVITEGSAVPLNYILYKGTSVVDSRTINSSEDFLYTLSQVRVSNNGLYQCRVELKNRYKTSDFISLKVTGISKPDLYLNTTSITEGEEITARCSADGESGKMVFMFNVNGRMVHQEELESNTAWAKLYLSSSGHHNISCNYFISLKLDIFKSDESNTILVSVKDIGIRPSLKITPYHNIFEGDQVNITCTVDKLQHSFDDVDLRLIRDTKPLKTGTTFISHNLTPLATPPELNLECRASVRNIVKLDRKTVSVAELFSVPTLTMLPNEVFQKDPIQLFCQSDKVATRLGKNELTYFLHPSENMSSTRYGVFSGQALQNDFNYTCTAEARGIVKHSNVLTVRPKVSVSSPKISTPDLVVLRRSFRISCQSENGSLPITYTLLKDYEEINHTKVYQPHRRAVFELTINNIEELHSYWCKATNGKESVSSKRLKTTVTVPLSQASLTAVPVLEDIAEGHDLYLMCRAEGTPPITFKWYRDGDTRPLNTTTTNNQYGSHQIPNLSKLHSDTYYCQADNYANIPVQSNRLQIEVHMAMWKKVLIGGSCLLLVSLLLMMGCVLCYRSKRVKVDRSPVSVWSERKPEPGDEDEADVAYTEVVHPHSLDPTRAPLRKGTDTVYSELQNSPHGTADYHDHGSAEYSEFSADQPNINHYHPHVSLHLDLPEPVD